MPARKKRAPTLQEKRSRASKKGWETRRAREREEEARRAQKARDLARKRARPAQRAPAAGARPATKAGSRKEPKREKESERERAQAKRSEAARKGHATRRAAEQQREAARALRRERDRARRAEEKEREAAEEEKRQKKRERDRERRARAKAAAEEKGLKRRGRRKHEPALTKEAVSWELADLFAHPPLGGTGAVYRYKDGTIETELRFPAWFEGDHREQWTEIEMHVRELLQSMGKGWVSLGVFFRAPSERRERYDREGRSNSQAWLYPRRLEHLPYLFVDMKKPASEERGGALMANLKRSGYVVTGFGIRTSNAPERPEHWR